VEFRKKSFLDEAEETESEPIKRTMRDLILTEGFRVAEAGILLYADSDFNEEQAVAAGQRIVRCLISCCEKIPKRKEAILVPHPFTISSETQANFLSWRKRASP
jgi:hypothetical protein